MGISKQMQMEEMHRVSIEEYDEDGRAKNDDAAFCAKENHDSDMRRQYDNNVIGSFIPGLQPYMAEGFANLEKAPSWFQWAMYASIAASFGIRTMKGFKK
tara:strand:+ start:70 stop:369 length:300 start_codon:yes stop_codon:yes gene_type:complete